MIVGLNRAVEHEGRQFHVQVEDLGEAHACFEVRLHEGGGILWRKPLPFLELPHVEFPVFKRQAEPCGLFLNQLGFSL